MLVPICEAPFPAALLASRGIYRLKLHIALHQQQRYSPPYSPIASSQQNCTQPRLKIPYLRQGSDPLGPVGKQSDSVTEIAQQVYQLARVCAIRQMLCAVTHLALPYLLRCQGRQDRRNQCIGTSVPRFYR